MLTLAVPLSPLAALVEALACKTTKPLEPVAVREPGVLLAPGCAVPTVALAIDDAAVPGAAHVTVVPE